MRLNNIFSSNMVFAEGLPVRIYGTGSGEAKITFAGQTKIVESNDDNWLVEFSPMQYGGPYTLTFETEKSVVSLEDIYIGDVYLFAGQSNMQFKVKDSLDSAALNDTVGNLRLFSTDRIENTDYYTSKDGWVKYQKEKVAEWSAVAYYTAKQIAETHNRAVGVITCYQGASVIESWVPSGIFKEHGIDIPIEQKHSDHTAQSFASWNSDGKLYEYAFSQVVPFSLSAVVWYQGESDTSLEESKYYKEELEILIKKWREDLRNPILPFVVVQIANYDFRNDKGWQTLQKAQLDIQHSAQNVKTVVSADVSESHNIHPPKKAELSKKIAAAIEEIKNV